MALDLFYFLSTLPTLHPGEKPPFSYSEFLGQCKDALSADDMRRIQALSIVPGNSAAGNDGAASQWFQFETFLRNTTAEIRMQINFARGTVAFAPKNADFISPGIRKQIEDAMAVTEPVERELELDTIRWNFLEELKSCHSFDFTALQIYSLQLQLAEKQASRDSAKGAAIFDKILEEGFNQATQNRVSNQEI